MTRAEKYLEEHPDALEEDGIPIETWETWAAILCVQEAGFFGVACQWQHDFGGDYSCEDCWNEEAE